MLKAALPNRVPELPIQPVSRFQCCKILGPARSTGPPPDAMLVVACAFDWAWSGSGRRSCQGRRVTRPSTVQRLPNATFHSNEWRTNRPGGQRVHFSRTRILGVPGVSFVEIYLDGRTTAVRVNLLNPDTSEGIYHPPIRHRLFLRAHPSVVLQAGLYRPALGGVGQTRLRPQCRSCGREPASPGSSISSNRS